MDEANVRHSREVERYARALRELAASTTVTDTVVPVVAGEEVR